MQLFKQKLVNNTAIIISFMLIFGCAMVRDPLGKKKITQLRTQAESIFRRQNAAMSQVMILTLDGENSALTQAEQAMQDACSDLNAYAVRLRDGMGDNLLEQKKVFNSLHECDASTRRLEILLQSVSYQ